MLRLIGWTLKVTAFAVLVLVLANWIRWDGKTISDQVRTQMSHAEDLSILETIKGWAEKLTLDARKGSTRKRSSGTSAAMKGSREEAGNDIPSSERQKLRALIRELNSSGLSN